jgi:hypothetical protein
LSEFRGEPNHRTGKKQEMLTLNPDFICRVRDVLAKAGFTEKGVLARLGVDQTLRIAPKEIPRLLRLTSEGTPLDTLIRLLVFGVEVDLTAAEQALQPMTLGSWCDGGLLRVQERGVGAPISLFPHGGFLIACDLPPHRLAGNIRANHVNGPGLISSWLLNATIEQKVTSVLDLGTGCGIQGMNCSIHSEKVVCTDINPRALNLASFNVSLNGLENIEVREGDLFDPVKGQTFDLITMNPPFVISPETRFSFRDGGLGGDGFVQRIVREAPAYLVEHGYCQITAEWAHVRGTDWVARLEGWFEGSACDVWVICLMTRDPGTYALNWISDTDKEGTDRYTLRWEEWMGYLEKQGIEKISTGIINMRRRKAQRNWFRVTEDIDGIDASAGEAILRGFNLRDFLSETSDQALLATPFQIVPDAVIENLSRSDGEGWNMERTILRHEKGLRYAGNIDIHIAKLIGQCNGRKTLGQLIDELAASLGVDAARIQDSALAALSNLIERGFLLPPTIPA